MLEYQQCVDKGKIVSKLAQQPNDEQMYSSDCIYLYLNY